MMLNGDSDDIDNLKEKINQLQTELNKKTNENVINQQKISTLEEEIIKLRELLPDSSSKKKGKKIKESKLILDLEAKDSEIRQLKDRMGFLRKEKIDVQKELEKIKNKNKTSSTVLRVEEIREKKPLNLLVKDLQEKIKKQESIINRLSHDGSAKDFEETIEHKNSVIESLNQKITELNDDLQNSEEKVQSEAVGNIQKKLMEDLQNKLHKMKRMNSDLRIKIEKYQSKNLDNKDLKISEMEKKIAELSKLLAQKDTESANLTDGSFDYQVVEELQNKLNKSKKQIEILQQQIANGGSPQSSSTTTEQLKMQREMATFLQNQLDDAKRALKTKVEEIGTIKNEAIRIKRKYEDLEKQLNMKEKIYNELRSEYEALSIRSQLSTSSKSTHNPQVELRIQELQGQIEDLTKQNIQQRLEIHQLRKNV